MTYDMRCVPRHVVCFVGGGTRVDGRSLAHKVNVAGTPTQNWRVDNCAVKRSIPAIMIKPSSGKDFNAVQRIASPGTKLLLALTPRGITHLLPRYYIYVSLWHPMYDFCVTCDTLCETERRVPAQQQQSAIGMCSWKITRDSHASPTGTCRKTCKMWTY